jgi:hypothetical protein
VRLLLTAVMNLLLVVGGLLVTRIVLAFFGHLAAAGWATEIMKLTAPLVPAFGLGRVVSPYRGAFDLDAGAALAAVLGFEWVAAVVRRSFR